MKDNVKKIGRQATDLKKAQSDKGPLPKIHKDLLILNINKTNMRVLWTARRSKQSILKEINPKYSLEGLMLKLKLQYFGHLM